MADVSPVLLEVADGVATVTFNRPDAMNSLDVATKEALLAALHEVADDPAVRCVVLTGTGKAFCTGQDLKEHIGLLENGGSDQLFRTVEEHFNPLVTTLAGMAKPVIAAVNGVAAGAGASLAFACDLRIASEDASFLLAFGRVGLIPDTGTTWFLPRLIGPARAAELAFTTDPLPAAEAERIGLVNRVVPPDRLMAETRSLAERLAQGAPRALAYAKRALNRSLEVSLADALEYEAALQGLAGRTEDHVEGVRAFIEKRPPRFRGE